MRIVVFFLASIFFVSCTHSGSSDKNVLGKKKMQEVLWDLIQAEAYTNLFIKKDSTKNSKDENMKLQQQIFDIHHTTKEDFYSSYHYYQNHPNELQPIIDSIISKKQQAERDKYMKAVQKK